MLVQWNCSGRVNFASGDPFAKEFFLASEFARLADLCNVKGMEMLAANELKMNILENRTEGKDKDGNLLEGNAWMLTSSIMNSAVLLLEEHPVRVILARASVETHFYGALGWYKGGS